MCLSEGFLEASAGVFEGFEGLCSVLQGSTGFSEGSDPMLVTLVPVGVQSEFSVFLSAGMKNRQIFYNTVCPST